MKSTGSKQKQEEGEKIQTKGAVHSQCKERYKSAEGKGIAGENRVVEINPFGWQ